MRQNWLSNRIFKSFDDIVDHCCYAWNTLIDQPWKIMSIARRDWAARRSVNLRVGIMHARFALADHRVVLIFIANRLGSRRDAERITVFGLRIFRASSTPGAKRYSPANTTRSMLLKATRFTRWEHEHGSGLRRERGVGDRHGRAFGAGQSFHLGIELI